MSTFAYQLQQFADKTNAKADDLVGRIVANVASRVDLRSPVGDPTLWKHKAPPGYVGGRFRGEWQLGVNQIPTVPTGVIDPSGGEAIASIIAAIPEKASGNVYYITNLMPYGQALEDGHSTQAPSGMVSLTAMEFPMLVREAAAA